MNDFLKPLPIQVFHFYVVAGSKFPNIFLALLINMYGSNMFI